MVEILALHFRALPAPGNAKLAQDHLETCPTCAYWEQTVHEAIQALGVDADEDALEPLRRALKVKSPESEVKDV